MLEVVKKIKKEELVFGLIMISAVLIKNQSNVPAMASSLLLGFYYLVFSWYIFPVDKERHIVFSILSGLVYAVCLIGIAVYSGKLYDGLFFYYIQFLFLLPQVLYLLFQKTWVDYKKLHFMRILTIVFLNIYIFLSTR